VISAILCHGVVVKREIEERFGIRFDSYFADALEKLGPCQADGLVELSPGEVRATSLGRVFLRNLAMPFDAFLETAPEKPVFSRTL
jgi:oxygen-independent coproporphyrinogen-3 oxidase